MTAPTIEEALAARRKSIPAREMSASRKVFWPEGGEWVYKFDNDDEYYVRQNDVEWAVYQYVIDHPELLPADTRVPEVRRLETEDGKTVIAMRYIDGQPTSYCSTYRGTCYCPKTRPVCWWREVKRLDQDDKDEYQPPIINDMHCANVLVDAHDVFWIIDLGFGSEEAGVESPNKY